MSFFCLFYFVLCSVTSSASNITASINSIPMLNDTNFKLLQENVIMVLGVMDLDFALRVARPIDLTEQSFSTEKREMERRSRSKYHESDDYELCHSKSI